MHAIREGLLIAAWSSFALLILVSLLVACVDCDATRKAPPAACGSASERWAFVPLPGSWSRRSKRFAQAILLSMATVATIGQAIAILLRPSEPTLVLLVAYNVINLGFVLSYWSGDAFLIVQALTVGTGSLFMWAATIFETYYVADTPGKDENEAALLLLTMWVLAACTTVDFTFYVIMPCCCGCCNGGTKESTLNDQLVRSSASSPKRQRSATVTTKQPIPMYTIGSDEEDVTSVIP